MRITRLTELAACALPVFLASPAIANCLSAGSNERLQNYCFINEIDGERIGLRTAQVIDARLKREGYEVGLGMPLEMDSSSIQFFAVPTLAYSSNINGGNPTEPLVLGQLVFDGNPELYRKAGILAGFGVGVRGREIYGEGRYLDYGLSGNYAVNPTHSVEVSNRSATVCSKNQITNWWFVDACANTSKITKELSDEIQSNASLSVARVFEGGNQSYNSVNVGLNRTFTDNYTQNELDLGWDTVHKGGVFTGFDVTFGEAVENKLTTRFSVSSTTSLSVANRQLTISLSYSEARGQLLFGVEREDVTKSITASYPIWGNLSASIGYSQTNSTIGYYDLEAPSIEIQLKPYAF